MGPKGQPAGSELPGPRHRGRLRLRRLQLRDFRGLRELELDLSYLGGAPLDVVVLRGGAGAGKTAALEAILLLLEAQDLLTAKADPRRQVRWGAESCELRADLELHAAGRSPEELLRRRLSASLHIDGEALSLWTLPTTQRRFEDPLARSDPDPALAEGAPLTLPWPPRGRIAYVPAGARAPFHDPLLRLFQRSQRYVEAVEHLGGPAGGASEPLAQVQAVRALFRRMDPLGRELRLLRRDDSGEDTLVVCAPELPLPEDVTSLSRAFALAGPRRLPRVLPIELLSDAERAVLALGAALCAREAPPDLVLLDQPEQGLPPDWQARLLPALKQAVPQAQLIAATHAEPIAASVLGYERIALPAPQRIQ
jgi:hypothetical protein